jgi:hypothetical protein
MTNQEAITIIGNLEDKDILFNPCDVQDAKTMAITALEQESKTEQFALWVATEIFDENWEYNKDAFEELACRKLAKLGIVRARGDEWEFVEPQERSDKC